MSSEFKKYFEFDKQFESLKIENDFTKLKNLSKSKFTTVFLFSAFGFIFIKYGLYYIINYKEVKHNFVYNFQLRKFLFGRKSNITSVRTNFINDLFQIIENNV